MGSPALSSIIFSKIPYPKTHGNSFVSQLLDCHVFSWMHSIPQVCRQRFRSYFQCQITIPQSWKLTRIHSLSCQLFLPMVPLPYRGPPSLLGISLSARFPISDFGNSPVQIHVMWFTQVFDIFQNDYPLSPVESLGSLSIYFSARFGISNPENS